MAPGCKIQGTHHIGIRLYGAQGMQGALDEAELMQRASKITGTDAVTLLHLVMYGARIRTVQKGEPCFYRDAETFDGWAWPRIDGRPVEPVRRLTLKDYNKAKMRARRRGISERQLHSYDRKVRREKFTVAQALDGLDDLVPSREAWLKYYSKYYSQ